MAIFSFKKKGKQEEEKQKETISPIENVPAPVYKFIPRSTLNTDASFAQDVTASKTPGSSTPSSLSHRNHRNNSYMADNEYFPPSSSVRKFAAHDPTLSNPKVALARRELGLGQYASDSGYESAGPSRAASEQNLAELPRQYLPPTNGDLLPELRLDDDSQSLMSTRSVSKKTRFSDVVQPMESAGQLPAQTLDLAILDGYKVNKKGKVLDEEGDVIGELVEGDLLDCVRQKVNANGQVYDEAGKVVGLVKRVQSRATSLPTLTIKPPTDGNANSSADDDSSPTRASRSPTSAPRSPTFDGAPTSHPTQDTLRRPTRSMSERSLSDLSKPYARPLMSSVPEDSAPGDENVVGTPEMFGYKGDIPSESNQHVRRRSASPPLLSAPSSIRKPNPRRVSTSALLSSRSFGKQAMGYAYRRGPLSSYETTPNGSDDGTDASNSDDGKFPSINYRRPTSLRSVSTTSAMPRTYFSHAGKVTVDPNSPNGRIIQIESLKTGEISLPSKETTAVVEKKEEMKKEDKKKNRLSLRFGKK